MKTRKYLLALCLPALSVFAESQANWKIEYRLPSKVLANYDTALTVTVSDASGKPVVGAEVETVLTMVDMDHGEFKAVAKPFKPGVYKAEQKFVMVGDWQIEIRAKKGKQSASQRFRYAVKE